MFFFSRCLKQIQVYLRTYCQYQPPSKCWLMEQTWNTHIWSNPWLPRSWLSKFHPSFNQHLPRHRLTSSNLLVQVRAPSPWRRRPSLSPHRPSWSLPESRTGQKIRHGVCLCPPYIPNFMIFQNYGYQTIIATVVLCCLVVFYLFFWEALWLSGEAYQICVFPKLRIIYM